MSVESTSVRIAFYSHDTYGLGHLTRTLRLARAAVEALPEASVLILSGSPVIQRIELPPHVDYIKLPCVVKVGPDTYGSKYLRISPRAIRAIRSTVIWDAMAFYAPDLLMVDNVPLGMKGELAQTLKYMKSRRPSVRICLNLRDVLDDPGVILKSWREKHVFDALNHIYDAIHVFGSSSVYNTAAAYRLPPQKTFSLGYISPLWDEHEVITPLPQAQSGRSRILVTVGGGGDGEQILECVLELQRKLGDSSPFQFHIVTGPLMDPANREAMNRAQFEVPGVTVHEYVEHLAAWMAVCDLVLSMGGYNTLCEVMVFAKRSIVIPRVYPRREQEIRARALKGRLELAVLDLAELSPAALGRALGESLQRAPRQLPGCSDLLTGIPQFQQRLKECLLSDYAPPSVVKERPDKGEEYAIADPRAS